MSNHSVKINKDLISCFGVILLTDKQTDRKYNLGGGETADTIASRYELQRGLQLLAGFYEYQESRTLHRCQLFSFNTGIYIRHLPALNEN